MQLAAKSAIAIAILLGLGASGCAPTESSRGYFADPARAEAISVGVDTRQTIADRLGTPTLRSAFDPNIWFYVSQTQQQVVWYEPVTTKQDIIKVTFDDRGRVTAVEHVDQAAMHHVHPVAEVTPTRGRELSFWEQMFGNIGRMPVSPAGEQGPGQNPGGGGGY